tara:strand:+ start:33 stop:653 length:621 start_codon:yes stop_codon:yes gene_type:complete
MRKDYFEITYKLRIREISAIVLGTLVLLFYAFPKVVESELVFEEAEFTEILNVEIVKPLQQQQQFKSARPSIPIEADEESEIDTLDFMDTDIESFGDWGAPPPPPTSGNRPKWVQYDQAPTPKKALRPKYPDICKQAGIEGTVVVSFWVDEAGIVDQSSIEILQSVPCLDQVCINEIKKSKWRPARQGRQKVGVPLSMPFNFTLEN